MLACRWPSDNPMTRELAKMGYYGRYARASWGGLVPAGMSGADLMALAKSLEPEYRRIFKSDPEDECRRRGALEGYETARAAS